MALCHGQQCVPLLLPALDPGTGCQPLQEASGLYFFKRALFLYRGGLAGPPNTPPWAVETMAVDTSTPSTSAWITKPSPIELRPLPPRHSGLASEYPLLWLYPL